MKDRITKTFAAPSNKLSGKITRDESILPFEKASEKKFFHIRSKHRDSYDFKALVKTHPALEKHVITNKYGTESVAFADPLAVKELNTALLLHFYDLQWWDIPKGYLCPPIPGRADYLHHVSDLFTQVSKLEIPALSCLDVGAGANCIYPLIGAREYGWSFIASDIDGEAIKNMELIISKNDGLADLIKPKLQENPDLMISGVLAKNSVVDALVCNPPFFESSQASSKATNRKLKNLGLGKDGKKPTHNFGGVPTELWTEGGERSFIKKLIIESVEWKKNCFWFTSLVSKKESLNTLLKTLNSVEAADVKIIRMNQGNKSSRILAWTFLDKKDQEAWAQKRFSKAKAKKEEVAKKEVVKKEVVKKAAPKKAVAKKAVAKKEVAKKAVAKKAAVKKEAPKKAVAKKAVAKKTAVKKEAPKKAVAKKAVATKEAVKKSAVKKEPAKKVTAKKVPVKKAAAKKAVTKKEVAKKVVTKKK